MSKRYAKMLELHYFNVSNIIIIQIGEKNILEFGFNFYTKSQLFNVKSKISKFTLLYKCLDKIYLEN